MNSTNGAASVGEARGDAPLNDEVCGAVPQDLAVGGTINWSGSFAGATDSEGYGVNTVWEAFTLTECARVTINWCGTSPVHPGYVDLRSGPCDTLQGYHAQSFIQPDCGDGNLVHTFSGLAPGTYYIMLGDHFAAEGTYALEATAVACPPPPVNDEACAVTPSILDVGTSVTFQGTLESATEAEGFYSNSVWEAFTLTACSDIVLDWCGSDDPYFWESAFLVVGQCDSLADGQIISLSAGEECGEPENRLSKVYSLSPGTYYLFIADAYGTSPQYNVVVSAVECLPPPPNDLCADIVAQPLSVDDTLAFTGTVLTATTAGDFEPGSAISENAVQTVWHAFTTTECSTVKVSYCPTDPAYYQFSSYLAIACPADSVVLGSWEVEACGNGSATIVYYDLPAGTYYIPVGRFGPFEWPYALELTATSCGATCAAWAQNGFPFYEKISNVLFAGVDNASTAGMGYEDFMTIEGDVVAGETYPLTVTLSNGYPFDQVLVWLDADQSNSFSESELLYTSPIGTGPFTGDLVIPADALAGQARLRLRMHDTDPTHGPSTEPCGAAQYGQVEDYTLNVTVGTGLSSLEVAPIRIYPNPNDGQFTLVVGAGGPVRLELVDVAGRVVRSEQHRIVAGTPLVLAWGGAVAAGSYVLHAFVQDQHSVEHIQIR